MQSFKNGFIRAIKGIVGLVLVCPIQSHADPYLYNLRVGSVLIAARTITVEAYDISQTLPTASGSLSCQLRMKKTKPYARIIPKNHRFYVSAVRRQGMSSRKGIESWTQVFIDSKDIDFIVCSKPRNTAEIRIHEFAQAMRENFRLDSLPPPHEIS
jgi:hypothetical protein